MTSKVFDKRNLAVVVMAATALWLASAASWAQAPATPTPPAAPRQPGPGPSKAPYEVTGFRSARFGMDEAQLKAAIQSDFQVKAEDIKPTVNAMERTTALIVTLPSLDPGPGPASVVYILGYKTKKLIQVNLVWTQPGEPGKSDGGPYLVAGVQLANYFNGFTWRDGKVTLTAPAGNNRLLVFGAEDSKTGSVQVVVDGVAFQRKPDGQLETTPQANANVTLRVAYIANLATPDVFKLEPGRF
ncbi:MAG: hypothetical protein JO055_13955 [Alphaproteobacteria bacterium]|nr:hypothetical protein [Alphaproteobacteria bacterium]